MALELALGSAFIDYLNGYPVGDITIGYRELGGTDVHVIRALRATFGSSFERAVRDHVRSEGGATQTGTTVGAEDVVSAPGVDVSRYFYGDLPAPSLARRFTDSLRASIAAGA